MNICTSACACPYPCQCSCPCKLVNVWSCNNIGELQTIYLMTLIVWLYKILIIIENFEIIFISSWWKEAKVFTLGTQGRNPNYHLVRQEKLTFGIDHSCPNHGHGTTHEDELVSKTWPPGANLKPPLNRGKQMHIRKL